MNNQVDDFCFCTGQWFSLCTLWRFKLKPRHVTILLSDLLKLLAGTEAGVILVLLFNPLWLTKTRLALQGATNNPRPYKGFIGELSLRETYLQTFHKFAVQAGMMINTSTGLQRSNVAMFEPLYWFKISRSEVKSVKRNYVHTCVWPDCLVTITREEGVTGLYKGVVPALFLTSHGAIQVHTNWPCWSVIAFGLYNISSFTFFEQFASYEWLKNQTKGFRASGTEQVVNENSWPVIVFKTRAHIWKAWTDYSRTQFSFNPYVFLSNAQPAWVSVVIGAAAKIFASTLTYPYQVVKSRLQQRDPVVSVSDKHFSEEVAQPRYRGTLDCVQKIWR